MGDVDFNVAKGKKEKRREEKTILRPGWTQRRSMSVTPVEQVERRPSDMTCDSSKSIKHLNELHSNLTERGKWSQKTHKPTFHSSLSSRHRTDTALRISEVLLSAQAGAIRCENPLDIKSNDCPVFMPVMDTLAGSAAPGRTRQRTNGI